jgi:rare lipoprotein A
MSALSAAHPTLPLPSLVYVTNMENGRTLLLRVNDRGPYVNNRVIDVSRAAARYLGFETRGTARVRVRYAGRAPLTGDDRQEQRFWRANRGSGWRCRSAYAAAEAASAMSAGLVSVDFAGP